ncbi:MAG: hypothetical protein EB060_04630 [Proteobacteria bacterium]|nr:hypothetical protein [Pseudomonadota bacterium]
MLENVLNSKILQPTAAFIPLDVNASAEFIYTKDEDLLNRFFELRRESYLTDKDMQGHFNAGRPDILDYKSEQLLAIKTNAEQRSEVIGGARMTCCFPEHPLMLPMETEEFSYKKLFPQYHLEENAYAEATRLVLAPAYRLSMKHQQQFSKDLLLRLYARCVELGVRYAFVVSTEKRCRLYQQLAKQLGCDVEFRWDIEIRMPKYDNVPMYVIVIDVNKQPMYEKIKRSLRSAVTREMLYKVDPRVYIGFKLVSAEFISMEQRDLILQKQRELATSQGNRVRFGELAAQLGLCTPEQIEYIIARG